jgi:hypothetical protein
MVNLSLCFIEPHTLKVYGRVKVQVHAFFILVVYGGEWSANVVVVVVVVGAVVAAAAVART